MSTIACACTSFHAGRNSRGVRLLQDGRRARPARLRPVLGSLGHASSRSRKPVVVAGKPAGLVPWKSRPGMTTQHLPNGRKRRRVERCKRLHRTATAQPVAVPSPHRIAARKWVFHQFAGALPHGEASGSIPQEAFRLVFLPNRGSELIAELDRTARDRARQRQGYRPR